MTLDTGLAGALALVGLWLLVQVPAMAEQDCAPVGEVQSICGLVAPEDMVALPGGRYLIVGQMGEPGGLFLIDTTDDSVLPLFAGEMKRTGLDPGWGHADCMQPPPWLEAHGLGLGEREDGRLALLVVNHHQRESVEFFEILETEVGPPAAIWRGCVEGNDEAAFNDVVALPDGGFMVSHMANREHLPWSAMPALVGFDTGFVYRWHSGGGFEAVPGSRGRLPNGISLSADGKALYINSYFGDEIRVVNPETGELLLQIPVEKPDNSNWTRDGRLLVASHRGSVLSVMASASHAADEVLDLPFAVVEVTHGSAETRQSAEIQAPPMGAGTVVVEHGDFYYIGAFKGDRVIKMPVPQELRR